MAHCLEFEFLALFCTRFGLLTKHGSGNSVLAGNAARQWLMIAVNHVVLCCVSCKNKYELICSNASTCLKHPLLVRD